MAHNVCGKHAAVFGAKNEMHRSNSDYQSAPKTVERPQLILELRFNRAYQQRERRACRCYAFVTGGEEH